MQKKPSNNEFKKVFDSVASDYDNITNSYAVDRRIEFFKKYAKGKCLEVGAGSGEVSRALLKNHTVVATDISPEMVKIIKKKLNIKAYVCDAEKLPFKNSSFDCVIAAEVIYYMDSPENFINEAYRVLKKDGLLLLSCANEDMKIYDRLRKVLRRIGIGSMYFDDPNESFFTIDALKRLLSSNKFKVILSKKIIIIPFGFAYQLNKILENTYFDFLGSFILVKAIKKK